MSQNAVCQCQYKLSNVRSLYYSFPATIVDITLKWTVQQFVGECSKKQHISCFFLYGVLCFSTSFVELRQMFSFSLSYYDDNKIIFLLAFQDADGNSGLDIILKRMEDQKCFMSCRWSPPPTLPTYEYNDEESCVR